MPEWLSGRVENVSARERIEVTDLLVDISSTGERHPVRKLDIQRRCIDHGDRWAARIVGSLPAVDGWLDDEHVDRLVVAAHGEIQRLSEEFRHGARMWNHLEPVIEAMRRARVVPPIRVVDVGCGSGYVIRWLAAHVEAVDVEFVGVDFNPALIATARSLAEQESLPCRFEVGDAFALDEPATVLISTGVLHHFRSADLDRFFAAHERSSALAFVHVDFQPSAIAGFGAWLFHRTRMRLAVSRHDGIRSAQRAHDPQLLVRVASSEAGSFTTRVSGQRVRGTPFPCVLTNLLGSRSGLSHTATDALAARAEPFEDGE